MNYVTRPRTVVLIVVLIVAVWAGWFYGGTYRVLNNLLQGRPSPAITRVELSHGGQIVSSRDPEVREYFHEMLSRAKPWDSAFSESSDVPIHAGDMRLQFSGGRRILRGVHSNNDGTEFHIYTWDSFAGLDETIYVTGVDDEAPPAVQDMFKIFDHNQQSPPGNN